uniref:EGF-like domain-containing protein n=1 Tax=Oreochromis aureus TaxID=47969 RepID=A0A668T283_OREAU
VKHFIRNNLFFVHYSQTLPVCNPDPCQNGGKCERLLDSNDWLCECPDGYYGDTCEKESTISVASETDLQHPSPG